ncbi:MAG TPA: PHB depolymerase family esterase [Burkholderiaceae bacterium]
MADATRLTRAGDLLAATAAIQAALRGTPASPEDDNVIEVAAREIDIDRDVDANIGASVPPPAPRAEERASRFITGSFAHAAGTRDYKLYVPPAYQGQALPMVVMLHGCTQDPDDFAAGTRMNEAGRGGDFFVLYPAQAHSANPSRCWNWFKHNHQRRGRGEPALLAELTREVMKRYGIDPRRVYVAGLSAGGAMAAILGETYPDLYAAIGVHSGLPVGSASNAHMAFEAMKHGPARPAATAATRPMIVFHGDRDTTVHPVNGEHLMAGCASTAEPELQRMRSENGREFTRQIYRDVGGRVLAEHWVVHGAGHAWSGGSPLGSYTDAKGPDATKEMVRFFFQNVMPVGG